MSKIANSRRFMREVWLLTKSYWLSEEKKKAFLLLAAIVALTLGVVYMLVQLNSWYNVFYSALQNYDKDEIIHQLFRFTGLAFIYIVLAVYCSYLQQVLAIHWRRWLTNRYIDEWMQHKTYYRLQMFGGYTDNPDQRISEDVRMFVNYTIKFTIGILKAFTTLCSFVVILYTISGPLDLKPLVGVDLQIPGYMVWVALLYAMVGTWLTYVVGNKLVGMNFVQQRFEADFRYSMVRLRDNAESVAFYNGETHEAGVFKKRFQALLDNFWHIIEKEKQLTWLQSGYGQIAIIFPLVVAMPRFLAKEITLGGLMQISSAFGRVQDALSYFVDMYSSIAEWQAVVERLTGFAQHMQKVQAEGPQQALAREVTEDGSVTTRELEIDLPQGGVLLAHVNVTLAAGENVLVKGVSGSGKSTLLRAIAGIWPYVKGQLSMPARDAVMFIPQKPYLPLGTLRDSVLYPGTRQVPDEALRALMDACRIGYLAEKLDEEADWSQTLSVGEQQRLAFVRAHIYAPQWLFLDEATSALDEATEARMYELLAERLPQTTLMSVGHRSTLTRFHAQTLFVDKERHTAGLVE